MSNFDDTADVDGFLNKMGQAFTPQMEVFGARFPVLASEETRVVTILEDDGPIPRGEYGFIEFYCNDIKCDCRRVQIRVCSENHPPDNSWAGINFGWETEAFYRKWLRASNEDAKGITGASLEPFASNSRYACDFLRLFQTHLMTDQNYVDRLARHYQIFKQSLKKPSGLKQLGRLGGGRRKRRR
jgi:hypothetical protein